MPAQPRNWIVVTSPANWEKTSELGWKLVGLKSTRRKLANSLRPGDRIVAYYTGRKQFGALLRVTSEPFEDHERIWSSPDKPREDYPFRVRTEPEIALPADRLVDAKALADRMTYTQKWPRENWTLAFQGNLHEIPDADLELIRAELQDAARATTVRAS